MLYKFKSAAAAEVVMLQPNAETLLKIIGKAPGPQGIITVEQIPAALAALRQAIEAQRRAGQSPATDDEQDEDDSSKDGISLERRAAPFIDLLERSAAEGQHVVWGV
jgi:hypothetical protein